MRDNNGSIQPGVKTSEIEAIRTELGARGSSKGRRISEKFVIAAIGAIPWVGGFLAAAAAIPADEAAERSDDLRTKWLEEHHRKLLQLRDTLDAIDDRFASLGPDVEQR